MRSVIVWYGIELVISCFLGLTSGHQVYLNQWAVAVDGGKPEADRIATEHGFVNQGQVGRVLA